MGSFRYANDFLLYNEEFAHITLRRVYMLDFNRRKKILRKLSDTAEKNVLLLLPCLAAAGLVKFFYFIDAWLNSTKI